MENQKSKTLAEKTAVVILAAGKGSRMGKPDMAKVCFEIDSVPAINRIINTFKKKKFNSFILVVGSKAEQIMETVNKAHSGITYIYQQPQLGTGHAAKVAAESLQNIGHDGNVLVTMGDKFIEEDAIESLIDGFIKQQADATLLTIPKTKATQGSGGRVFLNESGQVIDIIEKTDLARQAIIDELKEKGLKTQTITGSEIIKIINKHIPTAQKQKVAVKELLELAKSKGKVSKQKLNKILQSSEYKIEVGGKNYTAAQIEKACKGVNPSLYLFKSEAFYQGIALIDNNNAQKEYYLTDIIKHISNIKDSHGKAKFRTRAVPSNDPNIMQGFNSPDELLSIQDYLRRKKPKKGKAAGFTGKSSLKPNQYRTVRQWINQIEKPKPDLKQWLSKTYGKHENLHKEKCKDLLKVLKCYGKRFGLQEKVCIVRAPGRVNLMGRHVDHRGGYNNFLAIDRETIAVAGLRNDNNVVAVNAEPKKFEPVEFNITELIGQFAWADWINFVNSDWVRNMLYSAAGDWGNYIKAALLRLQHKFQDIKIKGLNLAVSGNVPIAAGLSSSSTLVVASLQAAIALNNFELTSQQFIDLCGEGEWFVGSRGGSGDHAAISLGQRGKIAHVGYLPFRVENIMDAPADYQVIIANSHIKATKSSSAKDLFNARIACYNLGLALLKQRCPEISHALDYVRDIDPEKIGCSTSDIYRFLLKVPQLMTRKDFKAKLSNEYKDLLETNFATHSDVKCYNVRGVLLFGAAEIMRSKICIDYLEAGQIEEFGKLMKISHDGDRVSKVNHKGTYYITEDNCTDEYLNKLIADLHSEDPQRVLNAQLYMQPGSYACSTIEIDKMVDIACSVSGVAGAQIAGAGLGGCIMILAKKDAVGNVHKALVKNYYKPNKLISGTLDCIAVEGAGLIEF